jgi:hypothetical protein
MLQVRSEAYPKVEQLKGALMVLALLTNIRLGSPRENTLSYYEHSAVKCFITLVPGALLFKRLVRKVTGMRAESSIRYTFLGKHKNCKINSVGNGVFTHEFDYASG